MEIDVTDLFNGELDAWYISNSVFNLGDNAAKITWEHALAAPNLVTDENRETIRDHFRAYGAWDEGDLLQWNDQSLSALLWQDAAADVQEHWDLEALDEQPWESRIFSADGRFYFTIGE